LGDFSASKQTKSNQEASKLYDPITCAILIFAAVAVVIILYIAIKAFKSPTLFFPEEESVDELATKLSCPKCRSRRLKPTGRYTIGCVNCGFTFSVGTVAKRPSATS